jgi:hypothetical protein
MKSLKILCGLVCFLLLAAQLWSMSHWNEARGVYDDICYLRQAHLFQRFGLGGFDTDIARDDDGYFAAKMKEIGFAVNAPPPCHTLMPASGKFVLQYPPGTGFMLALFPQGNQVVPLFMSATIIVFGFALAGILTARSMLSVLLATVFGCFAVYSMINPSKASYSMAPTMVVCAIAGYLTARLLGEARVNGRIWLTLSLGFLLGLSVNFRVANLFLSAGYFLFFLAVIVAGRKLKIALRGFGFGVAFLLGMSPTLVANAINAGNPLKTTYGGADVAAPDLSSAVIKLYVDDLQFPLLLLVVAAVAYLLGTRRQQGVRRVALVTLANLVVNLAFFVSHPIFQTYYLIPIAMLSLWSLSFTALAGPAEVVDENLVGQAANA